jgi:hypothetical protein
VIVHFGSAAALRSGALGSGLSDAANAGLPPMVYYMCTVNWDRAPRSNGLHGPNRLHRGADFGSDLRWRVVTDWDRCGIFWDRVLFFRSS